MEKVRCAWASKESHFDYHDNEWGTPTHDDRVLFEFIILEGAQAGLSWDTILARRAGYKKAFADFDPAKVARFTEKKILKLIENPEIIRNKLKIRSAVKNAQVFLEIQKEFGSFDTYVWSFVDKKTIVNVYSDTKGERPAVTTPESDALSKDLKRRGMSFVGSTIMHAYMQACGLVDDHSIECFMSKARSDTFFNVTPQT